MRDLVLAAKAFVTQQLKDWVNQFPGLRLRYYFEPSVDAHVVAVQPAWFHDSHPQFIRAQLALMDAVESNFSEHGMIYFTEPEGEYLLGEDTITITTDCVR
jgi:hypothetical protein